MFRADCDQHSVSSGMLAETSDVKLTVDCSWLWSVFVMMMNWDMPSWSVMFYEGEQTELYESSEYWCIDMSIINKLSTPQGSEFIPKLHFGRLRDIIRTYIETRSPFVIIVVEHRKPKKRDARIAHVFLTFSHSQWSLV